jgi:hypothetical protein
MRATASASASEAECASVGVSAMPWAAVIENPSPRVASARWPMAESSSVSPWHRCPLGPVAPAHHGAVTRKRAERDVLEAHDLQHGRAGVFTAPRLGTETVRPPAPAALPPTLGSVRLSMGICDETCNPRVAGQSGSRPRCPSRNQSRARARSDHGFESSGRHCRITPIAAAQRRPPRVAAPAAIQQPNSVAAECKGAIAPAEPLTWSPMVAWLPPARREETGVPYTGV